VGAGAVAVVLAVIATVALMLSQSGGSAPVRRPPTAPTVSANGAALANPALVSAFLGAANTDIAAVTTYDYRSMDEALQAGLAVTTGQYREAFRTAMTGDLSRTATAEHVIHTFEVLALGIGQMSPRGTWAKLLVFGRQRIADDATGPDAAISPITLCATVRRFGNRYLISNLVEGASAGLPPGGPDLPAAAEAARSEVTNLLSYRRVDFASDVRRALDAATSPLREQIAQGAAATKAAIRKGKYDSTGAVTAIAVVRADADTVGLMVQADESRAVDGSASPTVVPQRYEVTVTRTTQGWAASRVSSVDGAGAQ
jgi:hypothetical protein